MCWPAPLGSDAIHVILFWNQCVDGVKSNIKRIPLSLIIRPKWIAYWKDPKWTCRRQSLVNNNTIQQTIFYFHCSATVVLDDQFQNIHIKQVRHLRFLYAIECLGFVYASIYIYVTVYAPTAILVHNLHDLSVSCVKLVSQNFKVR